jgi:heat shock protein HslJ
VSDPVTIAAGDGPLDLGDLRLEMLSPGSFKTLMRCGETEIELEQVDEQLLRLRVDGQTIELVPVAAASGAQYAAKDDPVTSLWSKGHNAQLSLAGKALPECLPAVPVEQAPFKARGNEPGWNLTISGDRLQLTHAYGAEEIKARLPKPQVTDQGRLYQLPEQNLSLRISEHPCADSMTGMPYPNSVQVELADQQLTGCGGEPKALLEGAEWQVRSIAGEAVPDQVSVSIQFLDNDRVAGSSGCNRFMGGYQLTGEGLSFGQLASTMMACVDPQMQTEQRFLGLLRSVSRFEISEQGELVLIGAEEQRIIAER